ncbi:MAG: division/cell wall cluster transcriptional repressor MraZ [Gemmatimonadota bacterium]
MTGFLGSYLYQVDVKGRVTLPAAFRRGNESSSLVLVQAFSDALALYPEESWNTVEERFAQLVQRNPEMRRDALRFTANAHSVSPDKQGRILIPDRLRAAIGIEHDILIVGAINRIELWNPTQFAETGKQLDDEALNTIQTIFL